MFCSSLPEPSRKPGGVDVFVDNLASQLAAGGHDVTLYSYTRARDARYGSVQLQPESFAHRKVARMALVPLALNRLDTSTLDVMHLHGDDWFYAARSLPTVRTFYGSARHEARTATSAKRKASQVLTFGLEVLSSRLATRTYTINNENMGIYKAADTLPLAVDIPEVVDLRRAEPPTILFVGTWSGRKRGELLFETFCKQVLPRVPNAELHMVADECPAAQNVRWWDRPSDDQLRTLYERAWVFCLPSSYEGFGLPYAEAMAAGTPVVATPNPGAAHVLDGGRAGRIVRDEDLGQTLIELLSDEDARATLATRGRREVQRFSWAATVTAHEHAYAQAIEDWDAGRG